jgi:hypothetical protein
VTFEFCFHSELSLIIELLKLWDYDGPAHPPFAAPACNQQNGFKKRGPAKTHDDHPSTLPQILTFYFLLLTFSLSPHSHQIIAG